MVLGFWMERVIIGRNAVIQGVVGFGMLLRCCGLPYAGCSLALDVVVTGRRIRCYGIGILQEGESWSRLGRRDQEAPCASYSSSRLLEEVVHKLKYRMKRNCRRKIRHAVFATRSRGRQPSWGSTRLKPLRIEQ